MKTFAAYLVITCIMLACTVTFMTKLADHLPPTQAEIIVMEMRLK